MECKEPLESRETFLHFSCLSPSQILVIRAAKTGDLCQLRSQDRIYCYFPLFAELSPYHDLSRYIAEFDF
jgi:hypothetical protein